MSMAASSGSAAARFVAIVGPTGSGKTALAVELATRLQGEVINADVIQMYRGLDVASAKLTAASARGVPHHLLSFLPPRAPFSVLDFHRMARAAIADIGARGRLPIVVGGTMYYVQSLLRSGALLSEDEDLALAEGSARARDDENDGGSDDVSTDGMHPQSLAGEAASVATDYARLCIVDSVMARRLHANDGRKISRALAVFDRTGVPYSEMLTRQAARLRAASAAGADARNPVAHVFWTIAGDRSTHRARLDARVDGMLADGLLAELRRLRNYLASGDDADLSAPAGALPATELTLRLLREQPLTFAAPTQAASAAIAAQHEGLLQAIGYKEFEAYLAAGADDAAAAAALEHSVASLRHATHRYARAQDKFIRNRLWKRGVPLVQLDSAPPVGADEGTWWATAVAEPAVRSVQAWLAGAPPPLPALAVPPPTPPPASVSTDAAAAAATSFSADRLPYEDDVTRVFSWDKRRCDACVRVLNGAKEWEDHLRSRAHARVLARQRREAAAAAAGCGATQLAAP